MAAWVGEQNLNLNPAAEHCWPPGATAEMAAGDAGEWAGEWEETAAVPASTAALWTVLATVLMLFAGFTSAYLIRRAGPGWITIYASPLLWVNTALLLLSSLALEIAKTSRKLERQRAFRAWYLTGLLLGTGFLAGQWLVWQQLAALGIVLPTSAHGAFFYLLSGVHAVHVIGGLAALGWMLARRWRCAGRPAPGDGVNLCAIYWHVVTGIWVFLFWLLFTWR